MADTRSFFCMNALLIASLLSASTDGSGSDGLRVKIEGDTHHTESGQVVSSPYWSQEDAPLLQQIQFLIQNEYSRYVIQINVSEGVVTLKGAVNSSLDRQNIEQDIRRIRGVKEVNNLLSVSPLK